MQERQQASNPHDTWKRVDALFEKTDFTAGRWNLCWKTSCERITDGDLVRGAVWEFNVVFRARSVFTSWSMLFLKNLSLSFHLIHLDICFHTHTLSLHTLSSQAENETHTLCTVPWMMLLPTGIRMPPRIATAAPNTAPAMSPHLLLQHPMAVHVSLLPVCLSVCLSAGCLPSVSVCARGACCSSFVSRQQHGQAVPSEELMEQLRPGQGAHAPGCGPTLHNLKVGLRVRREASRLVSARTLNTRW